MDARVIELAVTTFPADPKRLEKFGRTKNKTWITRLVRFILRYDDSPITRYYADPPVGTPSTGSASGA